PRARGRVEAHARRRGLPGRALDALRFLQPDVRRRVRAVVRTDGDLARRCIRRSRPHARRPGPSGDVTARGRKRCQVVYATRPSQLVWTVELTESATVGDALSAARETATRDVAAAAEPLDVP